LAPLLCEIINQIFQDLDIPDSMKSGILTPILKRGKDKNIPGNYRGIVVTNNRWLVLLVFLYWWKLI
jgi:hypothetical protein